MYGLAVDWRCAARMAGSQRGRGGLRDGAQVVKAVARQSEKQRAAHAERPTEAGGSPLSGSASQTGSRIPKSRGDDCEINPQGATHGRIDQTAKLPRFMHQLQQKIA